MKVLILGGGSGQRLWPLSRKMLPKQFIRLSSEKSFLQKTWERNLIATPPENIFLITSAFYFDDIKRQIPIPENNILLEPEQKNTAPAIWYALKKMPIEANDVILVCPADHMITPQERYIDFVVQGEKLARDGFLVTFGVRPTRPETGYGYIKYERGCVEKFVEKPDAKTAERYLESGNYYWNSGLFAFTLKTFQQEMEKTCQEWIHLPFEKMPSISLDYALMEKSKHVAMVPLDLVWSDIGSWQNVYEMMDKDENQNVLKGDVLALDTTSSLIFSEKRHISTIGLHNILVVETEDAILVADKSQSQGVKEIVEALKDLGKKEALEHVTVNRPWGAYTVLMEGSRYKIKKIYVKPLQKLSLQLHYHRSEHWVVVTGTAKVQINDQETIVHEGESIFVPKSAVHRVENPGKVPLEIIEVQVGEYLGEDDIIRLEDVYGRIKEDNAFKILQEAAPAKNMNK